MANIFNYLKSTILSKVVMAVTGIILVLFILVHTLGNMQIYLGQEAFNKYSHFLHSTGELIWAFRIGLLLALVFHIITSIRLKFLNLGAKPTKYAVKGYVKSTFSSRTMIWTGVLVFLFVSYHLAHLTMGMTDKANFNNPEYYSVGTDIYPTLTTGIEREEGREFMKKNNGIEILSVRNDVYKAVVKGFQQPVVAVIYMLFVITLGFHLNHAMQSAFQSLGLNNKKYFNKLVNGSRILSVLIAILLISIPINVLVGVIGRGI
jgi:succinate dehydrogenase / fumarate reductase cytochrome b subunit